MHDGITRALEHWGLEDLRTSSQQELSGGERKRVLLAVQEVIQARLWILDEAFDDLDQRWRNQLKETIQASDKTILVLASRYLEEFTGLFDRWCCSTRKQSRIPPLMNFFPDSLTFAGTTCPIPWKAKCWKCRKSKSFLVRIWKPNESG